MTTEQMQIFTSLLALVALVGAALLLLTRLLASRVPALARIGAAVEDSALWLAFLVTAGATLGSLYFSEVANFTPCRLCWYQRIAMFPLPVTLLVAAIRKDRNVKFYVLPAALIGASISVYHYLLEWFPQIEKTSCDLSAPCTAVWFRGFGFVSLAFMALSGFLAVIALLTVRFPRS